MSGWLVICDKHQVTTQDFHDKHNIQLVVDCTGAHTAEHQYPPNTKVVNLPVNSTRNRNSELSLTVEAVALCLSRGGNVAIHCNQ